MLHLLGEVGVMRLHIRNLNDLSLKLSVYLNICMENHVLFACLSFGI